ncbi:hypothetical protein INT45_011564 [Circinella minor]|uniref:Uncharacterized protein n=1 Tax=Circinella minor TaxID=1195481 RepID=A0A8H7RS38_9FUNG|nr:hypothetical protein INT45_011564 [Circinella minor]
MAKVDDKVTHIESSVSHIEEDLQQRFVYEDPLLDISQDNELYKCMADYHIPVAGVIRKPDASKITQGLVRKHFIGEVFQLTGPNKEAMMDSMVKMTDSFRERLLAVWDAYPNKTMKTFRGLTKTVRDKLAMDVSLFLKRHLDDIPIDLCEKNWLSLYLVYHLFEKYISTSQRDKSRRTPARMVSMYSGSYMDTASEGGSSAVMSLTFFDDEDDNSTAANTSLSAAATSLTTTTTIQNHHLPSFSVPSSSSIPSTSDPVIFMQDNRYPKQPQGNFGLSSSSPSSSSSSLKRQRSKTNAVVLTNRRVILLVIGVTEI